MLPLWIIDLRVKSNRRDFFESLVGKIDHVYPYSKKGNSKLENSKLPDGDPKNVNSESGILSFAAEVSNSKPTIQEQLEILDQKEADRNSVIIGDYWRYSRMDDYFYGISISKDDSIKKQSNYDSEHIRCEVEDIPTAKGTAERLYKFQDDLVKEGQAFIKQIRASNAHPDIKINIVVLGDLTEEFTRIVFPAIAGILQKEKGRILPHHIHQGMEIIGMLYIPSDINTREVSERRSMQRTLNEIDVQNCVNDIRGYDHMMFYQDVQNRTECTYSILNDEQLAQYLLQCLVHLYLACNDSHPLLSGTTSADMFYFSMGAASVHFDTENEDLKGRHKLSMEFIKNFKSAGDDEKENQDLHIINIDDYTPESFFDSNAISKLDCDDINEGTPSPHPIYNFMAKYLKRYYYNIFLRFFTVNMLQRIINQIDDCTRSSLEAISTKSKRRFSDVQKSIFDSLGEIIGRISANDGGLPTIVRLFKEMQDNLSQRRSDIQRVLEQKFWKSIEETYISKDIQDRFIEYHDAYITDIKNKTGGTNQFEMKNQAVNELNGILSGESTMLSRICRSVLLGVMCALALVPVLNLLSPQIIDLGKVKRNSELWSIGLFFIPVIFQLISLWRYNRSKKRAINNLKAMYLHDAYARVSNRIESEINLFYDKMIALSDRYISRCDDIRKEIGELKEDEQGISIFPETMFNQPLIGGKFGASCLLPEKEADDTEIKINYIRYKLSEVTKVEYFLFINQNKDILKDLFRDVRLGENLIRRVKDNGEEELVTKKQQELEQLAAWEDHKKEFYQKLRDVVKDALLPRENSTVGEKLHHYCSLNPDKVDVLKPMIAYAATNGEVTSSADLEFADAKMNDKRVEEYILRYISSVNQMQSDKYNKVYRKYIFITRWRCFEHFNYNRILPTEDFDEKIRRERVYDEEIKYKGKKAKTNHRSMEEEKVQKEHSEDQKYTPKTSSLLLWALCPNDSSSEWFRLFDSEFFAEAYEDKNTYRMILNQND